MCCAKNLVQLLLFYEVSKEPPDYRSEWGCYWRKFGQIWAVGVVLSAVRRQWRSAGGKLPGVYANMGDYFSYACIPGEHW